MKFELYAYCLMNNHVHMFIKEKEQLEIKKIMLKLLTNYVGWYNRKYQRSGSLVGNRYKSEPVEDERYFFAVTRYIHQNPVKAGITENIEDYNWSSYNEYFGKNNELTDTYFILTILSDNEETAQQNFRELHKEIEIERFTIGDSKKLSDEQVKRKIISLLDGADSHSIGQKPKKARDEILRSLREKEGFTIGQLERVTGISRGIISRSYVQKQARPQYFNNGR